MDALIHLANVLFLASYVVRGVVWLRAFTIVALLSLVPYYLVHGLVAPAVWSSVFVAINLAQLLHLVSERRAAGRERAPATATATAATGLAALAGRLSETGRELVWMLDVARADRGLRRVASAARPCGAPACSASATLLVAHA